MAADGSVIISIDADGKLAIKELNDTGEKIDSLGDKSQKANKGMTELAAGATAVSVALIAVGKEVVEASTKFEAAYARTQTIMDEAEVSVRDMRRDVLQLSQDSAMAATDVSDAVYNAISGSVATKDAVAFVDQANKLSVAGFTSLASATDIMTTTLNAYGLSADKVGGISNVLISTQNLGKTTVNELSESMGRAISTASAYGVDLQNLSTAYVELTRGGIQTRMATTYLSGMFNELGDAGSKVGKIIAEQTGSSFGQLMAQGWSLGDVLQVLSDTVDGNAEAMMGLWGSQEAGKAANAIMTQSVEDFNAVLSQMNQEMTGTTGTTEKAYETMTSTSEFIDRRLSNSVTNLGIAFGDGLNPALNAVKTFFADVIEGFTEFLNDHPAVKAAITGLAVGITVATLALGVYTIGAKAAEKATLALTAAMDTNPIFLVITAIAALAVGLYTLVSSIIDTTDEFDEMTEASQRLETTVAETERTFNETRDEIEGTATVAGQYVARLKELESQQSMTAAEAEEYRTTVDKLRTIMPDLNVEIDEQSGLLKDGANALQSQIDNWHELAVAQALQEKYTQQIQAQAEAEAELAGNMATRERLTSELAVARDQQRQAADKAEEAERQFQNQMAEYDAETEKRIAGVKSMTDAEYEALRTSYLKAQADSDRYRQQANDFELSASELEDQLNTTNDAIEENNRVIEENAEQVEAAREAYNYYNDEVSSSNDFDSTVNSLKSSLEELTDSYIEAYDAAKKSMEGQYALWDDVAKVSAISVSSMIESQQKQAQYWTDYKSNIETLLAYSGQIPGLTEMVASFGDGSANSVNAIAGMAQSLAEGDTGTLAELVSDWQTTQEAIKGASTSLGALETGYPDRVKELRESFANTIVKEFGVSEEAATAATDAVNAYAQAILDNTDNAVSAAVALSSAVSAALDTNITVSVSGDSGVVGEDATGTTYARRGVTLVGEHGPELVFMSGGEQVITAAETRRMLAESYLIAPEMQTMSGGVPAAVGRTGGAQIRAIITVPLAIDGREFARATAEYIGEEMDFEVM